MEDEQLLDSEELETAEDTVDENAGEDNSSEESQDEVLTPEQIADLKAKAAKASELEEKNKQLFERAKKAEEGKGKKQPAGELSSRDAIAIAKADIADEDIDEVIGYAKYRKLSIAQALEDKTLKSILGERAEERQTALATQTRRGPNAPQKTDGAALLSRAERGEEINASPEDMAAIFQARLARGKKKG